jgi:N6-L-threonylcarbamoyladenine synthase
MMEKSGLRVIGIETSCDECAVAIVEDGSKILSNVVATQIPHHTPYQGVVPEIASRLHTEWIVPVTQRALDEASLNLDQIDAIAVANRPGLLGSLLVGVSFAKGLAATLEKPLIGIDHIRAHLYASQIEHPLQYPYLGVLVSGGHTIICRVEDYDTLEVLGTTIDDAIGEAFDKVAKHYQMGYPGGVVIDRLAKTGDPHAFLFPGPKLKSQLDLSYSGLKTAVINQAELFRSEGAEATPENIAASFQRTAINILMKRIKRALEETQLTRLAVGGGVAANSLLREEVQALKGVEVAFPSPKLCTDNGAMIAALAYRYLKDGVQSPLTLQTMARVKAFKKSYP